MMTEYIKREDLLELYDLGGIKVENAKVPLNVVIQTIKDMPSADVVERKRGKWIGGNGVDYVRCGCCHKNYDWVSQAQYYNFCPNCGADMRDKVV